MLLKISRILFLSSFLLLLYSAVSGTVGYHDKWILEGLEIPTILFVFSMSLLFVAGDTPPKTLALYSTVYLSLLNLLPSFKYSLPYGTGDILTHLGLVRGIYATGHLPPVEFFGYSNFPLLHILNASAALITGAVPIKIFKFIVPLLMAVGPLVIYVFSKRFYDDARLQKYAILAALFLYTNYNYFLGPASLATLLMFIIFTCIVTLAVTNRQYFGFSLTILVAILGIVLTHHFTSIVFLTVLLICAAWFAAAPESKKRNRILVLVPIFYTTILFSYWMYNAKWVFTLFAVSVKRYLLTPEESLKPLPIGAGIEKVGIDVFVFHHIGAMIVAGLSIIGILILLYDFFKKKNEFANGYQFFFYIGLYISANLLLFIYQSFAGVPLINVERMMILGFLFAPLFIAISLFKFENFLDRIKVKNKSSILIFYLFLLMSLTLIEFYPSERLLPGNSLNIANSEYMEYMANFVEKSPEEFQLIASDEVTRRVLTGFTNYGVWSKYSRAGSGANPYGLSSTLFLQFLDVPRPISEKLGLPDIEIDTKGQRIFYLLHRPGKGGIIYEFYEPNHPQEEKSWIIDGAIERKDADLIYDNGEAFILASR